MIRDWAAAATAFMFCSFWIFYEEQLKLDADEHTVSFVLTSDSQLYGKNVQLRDLRGLESSEYHSSASCEILPVPKFIS